MKSVYSNPVDLMFEDRPLLGMVTKKENMKGDYTYVPVIYGSGAGISSTFSDAQTNTSATKSVRFGLTPRNRPSNPVLKSTLPG